MGGGKSQAQSLVQPGLSVRLDTVVVCSTFVNRLPLSKVWSVCNGTTEGGVCVCVCEIGIFIAAHWMWRYWGSGVWQGLSPEKNNLHVNRKPGSSYISQRDVGSLGSRDWILHKINQNCTTWWSCKDLNVKYPLIYKTRDLGLQSPNDKLFYPSKQKIKR
jgi:hypothetical protein